ncbi:hypothetical protein LINPERPRIM_LOCUS31861 [Linum perenne]
MRCLTGGGKLYVRR